MKKSIYKYILGSFLVLFLVFSGGTSYAINPFEEINAVSQDPYSAHFLYLGMPEKEYEERFKSELWTKERDVSDNKGRIIIYYRHLDYGVFEALSVGMIGGTVGYVEFEFVFEFVHYEKANLINNMGKIACENITRVLGKAPNYKEDKNGTVRTLIWKTGIEQELDFVVDGSKMKDAKDPRFSISIKRWGDPAYL